MAVRRRRRFRINLNPHGTPSRYGKSVGSDGGASSSLRGRFNPPREIYPTKLLVAPFESRAQIAARIDAIIADDDMYETGEPRPSSQAVEYAKSLIMSLDEPAGRLPRADISLYFGEIDVTWKLKDRLLRLIVFSDSTRPAELYFQTDKGEALTRGETVALRGVPDLSEKLAWLRGR